MYKREEKVLQVIHGFTDSVIVARRKELEENAADDIATKEDDDVGAKKKIAFLDMLLQATIDGQPLSNADIREEVDTFMFEGHDTVNSGLAFILYNLAKHPEVQHRAYAEIDHKIGSENEKPLTMNDLSKLNYLEMVIKESLRLYPSVSCRFLLKAFTDLFISRFRFSEEKCLKTSRLENIHFLLDQMSTFRLT